MPAAIARRPDLLRAGRPRAPTLAGVAVMAGALAILSGCATTPGATAAADPNADLSRIHTFTFARPLATDANPHTSALSQHMEQATLREMRSRGMRQTSNQPQLIINFGSNARATPASVPSPPRLVPTDYYAYRDGQYGVWPGYRGGSAAASYPPGTINIDVVDAASQRLVWEAVVPGAIQPGSPDELKKAVDDAVKAAFKHYPKPSTGTGM